MAFQAPVHIQNIASVTSEFWPTMSTVLQAPWRGLGRHSSTGSVRHASTSAPARSREINIRESSRCSLPEPLATVPTSALQPSTLLGSLTAAPTTNGTLASVSRHGLRLCNPMARSMPIKAIMARHYSTSSQFGPLKNLHPSPRIGNVGLSLAQRRSLWGWSQNSGQSPGSGYQNSNLAALEKLALQNSQNANAQNAFYQALIRADKPEIVVERYKSGQFARNEACDNAFYKALEKSNGSAGDGTGNLNGHSAEQLQAIGQAVAARSGGGQLGKLRGGSGQRTDPLHVVVEESWWTTGFKFIKWVVTFGFTVYFGLILITLVVETSGVLKHRQGGGSAEVRPEHQNTKFNDVHGCDEAKEELKDIVDFLKNPDRYNKLGGRLPKGVLLIGPPGTGKTLLARAVAGEAGVPFFYMSGSEFDEMYVGVGAKRVRELFQAAKSKAPAIVFIDELDALGGKRSAKEANYHRQTLNQLLNDLDGFDQSSGVIFIGATNHPEILDKALTRPGRFDRHVNVDLPDIKGRIAILNHHLKKILLAPDVDVSKIARGTPGFSGAELENLANSAAVQASKKNRKHVTVIDLEWARDRIMMGAEKSSVQTHLKDKLSTAYHEGGHTLCCLYAEGAPDLHKATILPRGMSLGTTHFLQSESPSQSKQQYLARIQIAMAGKMAEEIVYGTDHTSSGASSDISNATDIAYSMVTMFGFSDRLGNVDFRRHYDHLSPKTRQLIDDEVRGLIDDNRAKAKEILKKHRKELDLLAQALVQYETLDKEEIMKVIKGEKLTDRIMAMPDTPIKIPELPMPTPPHLPPPSGGGGGGEGGGGGDPGVPA